MKDYGDARLVSTVTLNWMNRARLLTMMTTVLCSSSYTQSMAIGDRPLGLD